MEEVPNSLLFRERFAICRHLIGLVWWLGRWRVKANDVGGKNNYQWIFLGMMRLSFTISLLGTYAIDMDRTFDGSFSMI